MSTPDEPLDDADESEVVRGAGYSEAPDTGINYSLNEEHETDEEDEE